MTPLASGRVFDYAFVAPSRGRVHIMGQRGYTLCGRWLTRGPDMAGLTERPPDVMICKQCRAVEAVR